MNVLIDAVGIRGHGGASVLAGLLRTLPAVRPSWRWTVLLLRRGFREFDDPEVPPTVTLRSERPDRGILDRLEWVQRGVPRTAREMAADVVLGFANLSSVAPSVPQVLFCQQVLPLTREALPAIDARMYARVLLLRPWILAGARASARVIVQTRSMARRLLLAAPELSPRLRVIPSGFSLPLGPQGEPSRSPWRTIREPKLIYVSHPAHHKNHAGLLRALRLVAARVPRIRLLLTFDPGERRPEVPESVVLEAGRLVDRLGLSGHVVWLGRLEASDVFDALRHVTLHVFPSLAESFGLPLVESMAAGCPIAVSDLPFAHDVAGGAAVYFDPLDPRSIANSILETISDSRKLAEMRAAGEVRRTRFDYLVIAEQFARALEDAAGSAGRR